MKGEIKFYNSSPSSGKFLPDIDSKAFAIITEHGHPLDER